MERGESLASAADALLDRLCARFADVPAETVRHCLDDLWCCCTHLGLTPDTTLIERLAASRLTGIVKGRPARTPIAVPPPLPPPCPRGHAEPRTLSPAMSPALSGTPEPEPAVSSAPMIAARR
ncbi:hypothetical protein ACRB68_45250 [Actinomadura sp. RB68]|uniref:Uncharacterized protein n=1 Tax=Actinomadura macrotermitis TaxID=2585200 RepID=A0A7K0BZ37_9ACTN|nr:hypothetical protein [Actinomadura macrotermitis]